METKGARRERADLKVEITNATLRLKEPIEVNEWKSWVTFCWRTKRKKLEEA